MRALDCVCGRRLEAHDDEALFEKARTHLDQHHPDMPLNDEEVRDVVLDRAYEAGPSIGLTQTGR